MLRRFLSIRGITGLITALIGLVLLVLGAWLAVLGGSWYYLLSGLGLTISGVAIVAGSGLGLWLYGLVLLCTVVWAVWEVGLDGWQLLPRVFMPALLGVWLCLPFVAGRLSGFARPGRRWAGALACAVLAGLVIACGYWTTAGRYVQAENLPATVADATSPADTPEWRYYGRTADGSRFSPASQITPDNVAKLQVAWRYDTGDMPKDFEQANGREFNFEATPIKIGQRIYFCTPHRDVVALDATTGKQVWRFKPENDTSADEYLACRGVAYYDAPDAPDCKTRIISPTGDARLVALDAETGQPCQGFGDRGFVNLTDKLGIVPKGFHFISSQPLVIKDRVMLGGWIYDNQSEGEPSGVIRAFDPVSGKLAWAWDMGRQDPTAPLKEGEVWTRGTPNGWGTYTADPTLGMVYVPMGNAPPDYWGGKRRPFDETYSSAVVALDIETGQERWHFQTVHHDVWDFDVPIGPSLVDLKDANGQPVPALVQTTKTGEIFLLDRRNGQPLAKVEEKPVPQGALPGDHLSPTQPYSTGMPSLAPPDLVEADMWGATPIDQLVCRIQFHRLRYEGKFTPPTLGGDLAYPAFDGIVDWHGASLDPRRKLLIANASYIPFTVNAMTQEQAIKQGLMQPWKGFDSGEPYPKPANFAVGPQYGTPFAAVVKPFLGLFEAPCNAPPWGKLVAIDLQTRKVAWERVLGTTAAMNLFNTHTNVPLPTGMFNIGGNIITGSGLVFVAATADNTFRAFDERTGKLLWETGLPAGGQATPMTYMGPDGRQYVVIAAGGHGGLRTAPGDSLVAYALPRP